MIQLGEVKVQWIDTHNQLADPMTKSGASAAGLINVLRKGTFQKFWIPERTCCVEEKKKREHWKFC